jgi:hypothetical protein
MVFDLIARYYRYILVLLVGSIGLKVTLLYLYQGSINGFVGLLMAVIKWWSEDEQEMAETKRIQLFMRVQNGITIFIYILFSILLIAKYLPGFLR